MTIVQVAALAAGGTGSNKRAPGLAILYDRLARYEWSERATANEVIESASSPSLSACIVFVFSGEFRCEC